MKAIVLASGFSRRMGEQKLLLPVRGRPMLALVAENAAEAAFEEVLIVVSRELLSLATSLPAQTRVLVNEEPERGQSSSLRLGVEALSLADDFCVMLGDMPLVSAEQCVRYRALFYALRAGRSALVPRRGERTGHPVFFSSLWQARIRGVSGDMGARRLIRSFPEEVEWTEGEDAFFIDVDTPEDYFRMEKYA